jgi:hypothetical protein
MEIGSSIYEFKFDSIQDCCEKAYFLSYLGFDAQDAKENTLLDNCFVVGKTISRITFDSYSSKTKSDRKNYEVQALFFDENNDTIYTLLFNNTHNGYYPRVLSVNLYENKDDIPMKIFNTRL